MPQDLKMHQDICSGIKHMLEIQGLLNPVTLGALDAMSAKVCREFKKAGKAGLQLNVAYSYKRPVVVLTSGVGDQAEIVATIPVGQADILKFAKP